MPGQLALEPLGQLARGLDGSSGALALGALLLGLRAHLVEHAARVGELGAELGDPRGRLGDLAAGGLRLAARLLELGGLPLERALEVVGAAEGGLDRVGDLAGGGGGRVDLGVIVSSGWIGAGGSSTSGRKATIVPAARSSSSRRASPRIAAFTQSTTVRWLR